MKELTEEELNKLKPTWATHYRYNSSEVLFESKNQWCAFGLNFPFIKRGPFKRKSKLTRCKPIPAIEKKPFDITKHLWSDSDVGKAESSGDDLIIEDSDYDISSILINKCDAIAIAKHFGLTAGDLK